MMTTCPTCLGPEGLIVRQITVECLNCQSFRYKDLTVSYTRPAYLNPTPFPSTGSSLDQASASVADDNEYVNHQTDDSEDLESQFARFVREVEIGMDFMHLERDNRLFFARQKDNAHGRHSHELSELRKLLKLYQGWIDRTAAYPRRIEEFPDRIKGPSYTTLALLLDKIESFLVELEAASVSYKNSITLKRAAELQNSAASQLSDFLVELNRISIFMRLETGKLQAEARIAAYHKWIDVFASYPEQIETFPDSIKCKAYGKLKDALKELEDGLGAWQIYNGIAKDAEKNAQEREKVIALLYGSRPPRLLPEFDNYQGPGGATSPTHDSNRSASKSGASSGGGASEKLGLFPGFTPAMMCSSALEAVLKEMNIEFGAISRRIQSYFGRGMPPPVEEFSHSITRRDYWIARLKNIEPLIAGVPDTDQSKPDLVKKLNAHLDDLRAANDIYLKTIADTAREEAKRVAIWSQTSSDIFRIQRDMIESQRSAFAYNPRR